MSALLRFLSSFRLRFLFRGAFLLLALSILALALYLLQEEKQLSYKNYRHSFHKTEEQIAAKLRHPTGQLALLNPGYSEGNVTPLRPMLLPFSALDFDDQNKVRNAVEMAGCLVQYGQDGNVCVAIGNNPWAGGFIYIAGSFASERLQPHIQGETDLTSSHRIRVEVALRGQTYQWVAPFEYSPDMGQSGQSNPDVRGRFTGFVDVGDVLKPHTRPVREFRGWVWQAAECIQPERAEFRQGCQYQTFYSLRLPVEVLRDALFQKPRPVWPPADLNQIKARIQVLAPGVGQTLFDSNRDGAIPPFSLTALKPLLLPGESLRIRKLASQAQRELIHLTGSDETPDDSWRFLNRVIQQLPVDEQNAPIEARQLITTPVGIYEVLLTGDSRSVNKSLAVVAQRGAWFIGAMLLALLVAWVVIEIGIIRRIAKLTRRAASVSRSVKGSVGPEHLDLRDMRGGDELGILASCLHDLLQRVKEDAEREKIRAEQEKDMWHAVGHEIMSPLQSLMALHAAPDDPSQRYISRMQQAVRVLYGSASPSEAFQSTTLQVAAMDIDGFLQNVAGNAPCVGIENVQYQSLGQPVWVRADDYSLEDVVTHILRNADRYRVPGTAIELTLTTSETTVSVSIFNQGPPVADEMLDRIFEYGVSDHQDSAANGNRGQGLFVAKTYMAKMGGTILVQNQPEGVTFCLSLPRLNQA
ncbi:sensor histidine kinase [Parachitinimonas caeni]|uniref:histidine kinase n=1 Tax=Parachitinimonas caeni TaxID=3031301 RepID=A0ABT7DTF4_9NEIS|nr:HAMP domain-containing sensor histidine kinase [Parachitinimonas caeni]MDK2123362.1 HAMP domain-containing sensor histidine kinase [Parachitinimonas caeni]